MLTGTRTNTREFVERMVVIDLSLLIETGDDCEKGEGEKALEIGEEDCLETDSTESSSSVLILAFPMMLFSRISVRVVIHRYFSGRV